MDYVNYYITIVIISASLNPSTSITNTGPGEGSSIPKDFKRHIGLAPETNWEPGLREAVFQSLLKEHVTLTHLREKILQAPMSGQGDKVSPFGDVAILARGQLFANPNGFRLVQDPHPNDCIDCHELRQCYGKECEIYLHNGLGERLIALWTVKRLRHRNPDVRYELEYSVSPIRKHVWVTKNGGYDYSIPGHVFVVKTGSGQSGHSANDYHHGQHHDKYGHQGELPHYPHPAVPPKVHSNKHPFVPNKPVLNTEEWVPINQPPPLPAPPVPGKLPPNYYLPQRPDKPGGPGDQTASTSLKEAQPTLDYAEIEAYKNLLQVLHQKTSTTEQKVKPTKVPTTNTTPPSAATLPTRPPLSHTTWLIPMTSTKKIPTTKVTRPSTSSTSTSSTSELPRTSKTVETTRPIFSRPVISSLDTTKPTYSIFPATRPGTTSSFRPTTVQDYSTSVQQSTRPHTTIYQQLGGFDSSKTPLSPTSTLAMTSLTTQSRPISTFAMTYPIKTTIPMTHLPTQPSFSSDTTSSQDTTKVRETTQPMTTITTTRRQPKPTKPMTTLESRPTKPFTTLGVEWTRPADGQTTSTFLFPTKVTAPFGIGQATKPIRLPGITQQNTISTYPGKGTTFTYGTDSGKGSTLPMRYPTTSTFPGSTVPGSTFPGTYQDTTIPVRSTIPGLTVPAPPGRGTDQGNTNTTPGRGTTLQFVGATSLGTRFPPTNQYLPSTTLFSRPTDGTRGTTIYDHRSTPGTTYLPGSTIQHGGGSEIPTSPTGLLEATKPTGTFPGTFPKTPGYQRPRPTFFIDPTHPGYPKTTPTTPFTDGQAFKPSPPDPVYQPLPPLTRPSTIFTPPTIPATTLTDFTNSLSTSSSSTSSSSGTTLLLPAQTDRYTPPSTAHSHIISLPTKLPKPSTPFKVPAIDDYDVDLFPRDPNIIKSTTTTSAPSTIPVGDFILPEENYKPHPLVPELNPEEVEVFDIVAPVTSTTEGPTSTINPGEIREVFDSATLKPKPPIDESEFDEFFKQEAPTSTISSTAAKVIYSDFFEASTAPPTHVLTAFTTVPSTSQSYSTSVSIEVNNKNGAGAKTKTVKKLKFRKAKVKELPPLGDYKVYEAEQPEPEAPEHNKNQDLVENIEVTHRGNNEQPKYGPKGRKYKQNIKLKATSTVSTGVTKAFDDIALQLVNHARTIDYLEKRKDTGTDIEEVIPKSKTQPKHHGSNTNLQNRNKYKRKSYGRVRKVKKRTDNKAVITRANRGAIKASTTPTQSTTTKGVKNADVDGKSEVIAAIKEN